MKQRLLSLLILLNAVLCDAGECREVRLAERSEFRTEEILEWGGDSTESLEFRSRVVDSLIARGFFAAMADFTHDTLIVSTGGTFRCDDTRWLGDSIVIAQGVFERLPLRDGVEFEFRKITDSAQLLLEWFQENGHPYAAITTDSLAIDYDGKRVAPWMKIQSGPRVSLEFVEFGGNVISRASSLARETRLRLRTAYSESRVESARRRLQRLQYLKSVDAPSIVVNDEGKTGLFFRVQESRLSRIDIAAGLTPDASGGNETITGLADLQFLNLFGAGRRGRLAWKRPAKSVQELSLAWREPWLLGSPLALDLSFSQRVEDTLYVTRSHGAQIAAPLLPNLEVWGGIAREEFLVDSVRAVQLSVTENRTTLYETGVRVDTRDHRTNPRSGVRFETWAAHGDRATGTPPLGSERTNFTQQRASAELEYASELLGNWLLNLSGRARIIESDEPAIPFADLIKLGGARSLRGYREEQFAGSRVGSASVELRYWLGSASRFAMFYDAGEVYRQTRNATGESVSEQILPTSYGAGMRLETGIGIWGIDYGVASGTSALSGQLHVSLLSLF
ncbi:BamA/TamA family outer membrane protein [bacterium]|nr:BamA/TamA family outer membrane protein [bacterium]